MGESDEDDETSGIVNHVPVHHHCVDSMSNSSIDLNCSVSILFLVFAHFLASSVHIVVVVVVDFVQLFCCESFVRYCIVIMDRRNDLLLLLDHHCLSDDCFSVKMVKRIVVMNYSDID